MRFDLITHFMVRKILRITIFGPQNSKIISINDSYGINLLPYLPRDMLLLVVTDFDKLNSIMCLSQCYNLSTESIRFSEKVLPPMMQMLRFVCLNPSKTTNIPSTDLFVMITSRITSFSYVGLKYKLRFNPILLNKEILKCSSTSFALRLEYLKRNYSIIPRLNLFVQEWLLARIIQSYAFKYYNWD